MSEQPERLAALISRYDEIVETVTGVRPEPLAGTSVVARGSSDHAGVCGRYLIEEASGRPVAMAAPSLQTLYRAAVDFSGYLAIAVSQSGWTPEIVTTLERMQAASAHGLAITNEGSSPLAGAAQATLELAAGPERAVPATKTVTAALAAFALVAAALGEAPFSRRQLAQVPDWATQVLDDPVPSKRVAARLEDVTRLLTVGRGLLFGVALEAALKLKETAMLSAEGLSGADLRHGPIALVVRGLPVLTFVARGPAHADMIELVEDLRRRGAEVFVAGPDAGANLPLPADVPEALVPIVAVIRAQQVALALARARGLDPDAPAGLSKVTAT